VNNRPKHWVVDQFQRLGWQHDSTATRVLAKASKRNSILRHNILVFRRQHPDPQPALPSDLADDYGVQGDSATLAMHRMSGQIGWLRLVSSSFQATSEENDRDSLAESTEEEALTVLRGQVASLLVRRADERYMRRKAEGLTDASRQDLHKINGKLYKTLSKLH
jgi:hypothetical protein